MEKTVDIGFHIDDKQLKESHKTIKELNKEFKELQQRQQFLQGSESYKQEVKAFKDTTVMVLNETKTATKDMVVDSKKYLDILIETVSIFFSTSSKAGPWVGGGVAAAYLAYSLEAKSREDKPETVPFSEFELMKSGTMAKLLEKQERVKHLGEFSKKRVDSEEEVSKGILAILQKQKDQILKDLDKLDVKGDMKQILTLKETIDAINIQADAEGIMLRGIKAFREKQAREAAKNTPQSPPKSPDTRTLPNAEVNPLAVKKAGDVVGLLYTQMKEVKLTTVELGKSFQQTGQQGGKSFFELINLSGKLKTTLASGLDVVSQKIQQGTRSTLRWSLPLAPRGHQPMVERWAPPSTFAMAA